MYAPENTPQAYKRGFRAGYAGDLAHATIDFTMGHPFADYDYKDGFKAGANEAHWHAVRQSLATDVLTRAIGRGFTQNRCGHCQAVYASNQPHTCKEQA